MNNQQKHVIDCIKLITQNEKSKVMKYLLSLLTIIAVACDSSLTSSTEEPESAVRLTTMQQDSIEHAEHAEVCEESIRKFQQKEVDTYDGILAECEPALVAKDDSGKAYGDNTRLNYRRYHSIKYGYLYF